MTSKVCWLQAAVGLIGSLLVALPANVRAQSDERCSLEAAVGGSFQSVEKVTRNGAVIREPTGNGLTGALGLSCRLYKDLSLGGAVESDEEVDLARFLGSLSLRLTSFRGLPADLVVRAVGGYATGSEDAVVPTSLPGTDFIAFDGGGPTAGASIRIPYRLSKEFRSYAEAGWRWHEFDRLEVPPANVAGDFEPAGSEPVHAFPIVVGLMWML